MRHALSVALLLLAAISLHGVRAQQADDLNPILNVKIEPPRVVVGQPATLEIVALAPNYMTSPPELPDFQVRNAVTRPLQSTNVSEDRNGLTYAGVRYRFAIYPQETGSYAIPEQHVGITYAAAPPATRHVSVPLPSVTFEAFIPNDATSLQPFLSATRLTVEQAIERSSDQLKAGDAVKRSITIHGEGTLAMLLPPQAFVPIEGLRSYPAQPVLEDKTAGRSDVMTSTRIDAATYMIERPGEYSLPAIDIGWWNTGSGKIEQIHLDAIALSVAVNPAAGDAAAGGATGSSWTWRTLIAFAADHWLLLTSALVAIAGLAWIAPTVQRRAANALHHRRAAYLASEAWSFRQLRHAARRGGAQAVYFGLLGWLQRFEPIGYAGTVDALTSAAGDPALTQEINALRSELFASRRDAENWSPHTLMRHVNSARRRLRKGSRHAHARQALPQEINPGAARSMALIRRRVAR